MPEVGIVQQREASMGLNEKLFSPILIKFLFRLCFLWSRTVNSLQYTVDTTNTFVSSSINDEIIIWTCDKLK